MMNEFERITKPVVKYLWNEGYFTVPLPRDERKEFKLDMPAFERFDIVAIRWNERKGLKLLRLKTGRIGRT